MPATLAGDVLGRGSAGGQPATSDQDVDTADADRLGRDQHLPGTGFGSESSTAAGFRLTRNSRPWTTGATSRTVSSLSESDYVSVDLVGVLTATAGMLRPQCGSSFGVAGRAA